MSRIITDQTGLQIAATLDSIAKRGDINNINNKLSSLQKHNNDQDKQIENLNAILNGYTHVVQSDSTNAYSKNIPKGAMTYASIDYLQGRTIYWNQLADDITADTWTLAQGSSIRDGVCHGSATSKRQFLSIAGHKYYVSCWVNTEGAGKQTNLIRVQLRLAAMCTLTTRKTLGWQRVDGIFTPTADYASSYMRVRDTRTDSNLNDFDFTNYMLIDLTLMFGEGNQPSVQEVRSMFPYGHYDYSSGQLRSFAANKIVSYCSNLVQGEINRAVADNGTLNASWTDLKMMYAKVQQGKVYCILGPETTYTYGFFYEVPEKNSVTYNHSRRRNYPPLFMAQITGYVGVNCNVGDQLQISLGYTPVPYHPYEPPIEYDISQIVSKYFDGQMRSSGYAKDEIRFDDQQTIKRVSSNEQPGTNQYAQLNIPIVKDISNGVEKFIKVFPDGRLEFKNKYGDQFQIPLGSQINYIVSLLEE